MKKLIRPIFMFGLLTLLAAGCTVSAPSASVATATPTTSPTESAEPMTATPQKTYLSNIPYTTSDINFQRLDVFLPADADAPHPTILAIHGGGFRARSKSLYTRLGLSLREKGIALVATNYRYSSVAPYPAQVEDVFCALAWIYANAETFNFDTENIYVMGGSAGGYLAAMIGAVDTADNYLGDCPNTLPGAGWVQGTIALYGFFDLTDVSSHNPSAVAGLLAPFIGMPYDEAPQALLEEMSPSYWVDGGEAPFLLIHGTQDTTVASWESERFAVQLEEQGVTVDLLLVEAKHGFELEALDDPIYGAALARIDEFLNTLVSR